MNRQNVKTILSSSFWKRHGYDAPVVGIGSATNSVPLLEKAFRTAIQFRRARLNAEVLHEHGYQGVPLEHV
ncbi:hypothetical protein [Mycobacterium riyadhense]|uniref:hypothetical protein n=1 Tax=Mycobacterium riyadhense TaxID=486698 RepID=UPI00111C5D57|nr:hypothetical protein [Mycobacterium riyadhense]MCV7144508.1 hypothetical protein [Mycobacterium riyadhense]